MSEGFFCRLPAGDLTARVADLRALMAASLLRADRPGERVLRLAFAATAEADVRAAVDRERECCAFLAFEVTATAGAVEVEITAPPGAEAVLDGFTGLAEVAGR